MARAAHWAAPELLTVAGALVTCGLLMPVVSRLENGAALVAGIGSIPPLCVGLVELVATKIVERRCDPNRVLYVKIAMRLVPLTAACLVSVVERAQLLGSHVGGGVSAVLPVRLLYSSVVHTLPLKVHVWVAAVECVLLYYAHSGQAHASPTAACGQLLLAVAATTVLVAAMQRLERFLLPPPLQQRAKQKGRALHESAERSQQHAAAAAAAKPPTPLREQPAIAAAGAKSSKCADLQPGTEERAMVPVLAGAQAGTAATPSAVPKAELCSGVAADQQLLLDIRQAMEVLHHQQQQLRRQQRHAQQHDAPATQAGTRAAVLMSLQAMGGGDAYVQRLATTATAVAAQPPPALRSVYKSMVRMTPVGAKVVTQQSHCFGEVAGVLTSSLQAASYLRSAGTAQVRMVVVPGCVQLLAVVSMVRADAPGTDTGTGFGGGSGGPAVGTSSGGGGDWAMDGSHAGLLLDGLHEGVVGRLSALLAARGQPMPDVHVCVGARAASVKDGAATDAAVVAAAERSAAEGVTNVGFEPVCLVEQQQQQCVHLYLDLAPAAADAEVAATEAAAAMPIACRVVVFGEGRAVADKECKLMRGTMNALRLELPPLPVGVLHVAVLVGGHQLAGVQPLLVLPQPAAADLRTLWALQLQQEALRELVYGAMPPAVHEDETLPSRDIGAAQVTRAWQGRFASLLQDLAYVLGVSQVKQQPSDAAQRAEAARKAVLLQLAPFLAANSLWELLLALLAGSVPQVAAGEASAARQLLPRQGGGQEGAQGPQQVTAQESTTPAYALAGGAAAHKLRQRRRPEQASRVATAAASSNCRVIDASSSSGGGAGTSSSGSGGVWVAANMFNECSASDNSSEDAAAAAVALEQHTRRLAPWGLYWAMLSGFKAPEHEARFKAYKQCITASVDVFNVVFHLCGLVIMLLDYGSPQAGTELKAFATKLLLMLSYGCFPVALTLMRQHLPMGGREVVMAAFELMLGLIALAMALGALLLPPMIDNLLCRQSVLGDGVLLVAYAVRACSHQLVVRWHLPLQAVDLGAQALHAWAHGDVPPLNLALRFLGGWVLIAGLSTKLELHARRGYLRATAKIKRGAA